MIRPIACFLLLLAPILAQGDSPFEGRWRLDKARSTALDGWHEWDLIIDIADSQVSLRHDMRWGRTQFSATNVLSLGQPASLPDFFRVEQRHMALYPAKGAAATVRTAWLDGERTLRVEADVPLEISQGQAVMRLYSEYRLLEGDRDLVLIELHHSRPRPLVYRFTKISPEK
jgi:hypothetical protein